MEQARADKRRYCFHTGEEGMRIKNYCSLLSLAIWLKMYARLNTICGDWKFPGFRKGVYIEWQSLSKDTISDHGKINYDNAINKIDSVRFVATLSIGKTYFSDEKEKFQIRIKLNFRYKALKPHERLNLSYDEITYDKILGANNDNRNVISNLTLPTRTSYGMHIKWYSSDKRYLEGNQVKRGRKDRSVSLTAKIFGCGSYIYKKFDLIIKARKEKDTRILIMVPHGDDEIFMTYNVIRKAVLNAWKIYICFFCNTDTKGTQSAEQRHRESMKVLGYLGVKRDRIFSLGYSTKWKGSHIYNESDKVSVSINGDTYTYGTKYIKDWHTLRNGFPAAYTRENVISDICDVIQSILPDSIFVNDFDKHIDHIAYSLLFEEAIGICLKTNKAYHPLIYKGFVYSTNAYGKPDLFKIIVPYTIKPSSNNKYYPIEYRTELENPELCWNDRVSFKTAKELLNKDIYNNPAARAILMYHRMYRNIPCFIKKDSVFWLRRTDNYCIHAKIETSSGNSAFLNDFKLTDVKRLNVPPYEFNAGEWIPDERDENKEIRITFPRKVNIKNLRFYRNRGKRYVTKIILQYEDQILHYQLFKKDEPYKELKVNIRQVDCLKIHITGREGKWTGFTEIEAYGDR